MFVYFALLCPGMLLIAWTAIMLTEKRSTTNNLLTVTLALCAIHILAEGIYLSPTAKVSHIALVNIVRQIFGPIVLPFIHVCQSTLRQENHKLAHAYMVYSCNITVHRHYSVYDSDGRTSCQ